MPCYFFFPLAILKLWHKRKRSHKSLPTLNLEIRILGGFFWFFFFLLFRAALAAYGESQARGQTRAVAAGLCHSSWQRQILNLLSKARVQTFVLMDASQIH